jgi:hypothetical protein
VDPSLGSDGARHELSRLTNRGQLRGFNVVHYGSGVREPGLGKHLDEGKWTLSLTAVSRQAAT